MRSIKANIALHAVKTVFSIVFPIISFKYVSSMLGVTNIGKVTFSSSIVSYFALFASLGIASYGIREGARIRDDAPLTTTFVSELFTINIVSTLFSYLVLIICVITLEALNGYESLILILSSSILCSAFGMDWVNIIHEDFLFLTVRQILVQIIGYLLIILVVKKQSDVLFYCMLTAGSAWAVSILNFFHVRKRNKFHLAHYSAAIKHIKPVMVIFASSIAVTIYVSSDATMLGLLAGDKIVGLYAGAAKVYASVKMLIAAIIIVVLPRITTYADNPPKFSEAFLYILSVVMLITLPCVVGICVMSERIIVMLSSQDYADGASALTILGIAVLFSIIASVITTTVFLPLRKEKVTLVATILSALLNIALNLLLIPLLKHRGAALTTMLAEALICGISIFYLHKCTSFLASDLRQTRRELKTYTLGSIVIGACAWLLSSWLPKTAIITFGIIVVCAVFYFLFLYMFRNRYTMSVVTSVTSMIKRVI